MEQLKENKDDFFTVRCIKKGSIEYRIGKEYKAKYPKIKTKQKMLAVWNEWDEAYLMPESMFVIIER